MIRVKVWIETDKVGSKCIDYLEYDEEEWESMSERERDEDCREVAFQMGEWGYQVEENDCEN